jgi:hypothetical protein
MRLMSTGKAFDLCRALAPAEAAPFLRHLRLDAPLRAELPRLARLALAQLEAGEGIPHLAGIPEEAGSQGEVERAVEVVAAVAEVIVPTDAQMGAMYGWLEALCDDVDRRVATLPLPAAAVARLGMLCHSAGELLDDVQPLQSAYVERHGQAGGWPTLAAILHWSMFSEAFHELYGTLSEAERNATVSILRLAGPVGEPSPFDLVAGPPE